MATVVDNFSCDGITYTVTVEIDQSITVDLFGGTVPPANLSAACMMARGYLEDQEIQQICLAPLFTDVDPNLDDLYSVRATAFYPYVNLVLLETDSASCPICVIIGSTTVINETASGLNDGQITVNTTTAGPYEYSLNGGTFQAGNVFSNLSPGPYTLVIREQATPLCNITLFTQVQAGSGIFDPLLTGTDVSIPSGSDGSIITTITGGSGNFTFAWADGPITQNRFNLTSGSYSVVITDTVTTIMLSSTILISEPEFVRPPAFFEVSPAMSIQMAITETVSGCTVFTTHDNVLYNSQNIPGYTIDCYYQKYQRCDSTKIQWRSNYNSNNASITDRDGTLVQSLTPVLKVENVGLTDSFNGFIKDNGNNTTQVFFDDLIFPDVNVDDVIEIVTPVSDAGRYRVISTGFDATEGKNFAVVNLSYTSMNPQETASYLLDIAQVDFNVYEADINFGSLASGLYQVKIEVEDDDYENKTALSELIHVAESHPGTNVIRYKNFDNSFLLDYTGGFENIIRIESYFFKRIPGGEEQTHIDGTRDVKVNAKFFRFTLLEILQVPPWMHEKITLAISHDFMSVNGVEHATSDFYEPDYIDLYGLSSGSIRLKQVGFMNEFNTDDVGSVAEGQGFLIVDGGFLRL